MNPPPRLEDLVGLPLWVAGRAANLLWLQFGRRRTLPLRDVTREVGELAVHISCPWRFLAQDGVVTGSQDLGFPLGCSKSAQVPDDYDWDKSPSRLDGLLEHINQNVLPLRVVCVAKDRADSLLISLEDDYALEAFPVCSSESEHWRLFEPGADDREHLVAESQPAKPGVTDTPALQYTAAHAAVRFSGSSLDPLDVTLALRLPHDLARRSGEPRIRRRRPTGTVHEYAPLSRGMWSMSSERWVRSSNLDQHVRWLLDQLEPRAAEIRPFIESDVDVDIFCFSVGLPSDPPALPAETIRRAEALSIPVNIDYYCTDKER